MPPKGKLAEPRGRAADPLGRHGRPRPEGRDADRSPGAGGRLRAGAGTSGRSGRRRTRPIPAVADRAWPRSPLDRFILAKLEASGPAPAPEADKRTLIRRATFDLIGLPPTPEEVEAFLADDSPDAFARVVDRLLASPHYGERWGRHWLDVARYADSNGLDENIAYGNAWRYRDYVIAAFNADKPYDQFVLEQLAGDLLPAGRVDGRDRTSAGSRPASSRSGPKVAGRGRRAEDGDGHRRRADRHGRPGLPGPDARLRPLPRPQVRPDLHGRLLRAGRDLPEHPDDGVAQEARASGTSTRSAPKQELARQAAARAGGQAAEGRDRQAGRARRTNA